MEKMLVVTVKMLVVGACVLVTLVWAEAQQLGKSAQAISASSQGSNPQPARPGTADQNAPQTGAQAGGPDQAAPPPITEGCLGGSSPNFTITDKAGTTYKLNLPPNADASMLTRHLGESVQVIGDVKRAGSTNSIDVRKMGRGTGMCPANSPSGGQPPPKQ